MAPLGRHRATLAVTGVGLDAARRFADSCLEGGRYDLMVSTGLCGALAPHLRPGELVASEKLFFEDGRCVFPDKHLYKQMRMANPGTALGPTLSVKESVREPALKASLYASTGAISVDMESAALLEAAARHKLPAVSLRAVMDRADEALTLHWTEYRKQNQDTLSKALDALCEGIKNFAEAIN